MKFLWLIEDPILDSAIQLKHFMCNVCRDLYIYIYLEMP